MYLRPHIWSDCPEVHTSKLKAAEKIEEKKRVAVKLIKKVWKETQQQELHVLIKAQKKENPNHLCTCQKK